MRQAAHRWWIKQVLHERWVADLGAHPADGHIIDGFPIAICQLAHAVRRPVRKVEADDGYWAAKREDYYGLKAHFLSDRRGVAVGIPASGACGAQELNAITEMALWEFAGYEFN